MISQLFRTIVIVIVLAIAGVVFWALTSRSDVTNIQDEVQVSTENEAAAEVGSDIQDEVQIQAESDAASDVELDNRVDTETDSSVEVHVDVSNESSADHSDPAFRLEISRDVAIALLAVIGAVAVTFVGGKTVAHNFRRKPKE